MGWLILFMIFSLMFTTMNMTNYYMINYQSNYKWITSKNKNKNIYWMW